MEDVNHVSNSLLTAFDSPDLSNLSLFQNCKELTEQQQ